jgi:hypothetical protein
MFRASGSNEVIRRRYANQWVAIDPAADNSSGPRVSGGVIIDADEDFGELCSRLVVANRRNCTIVFSTCLN